MLTIQKLPQFGMTVLANLKIQNLFRFVLLYIYFIGILSNRPAENMYNSKVEGILFLK